MNLSLVKGDNLLRWGMNFISVERPMDNRGSKSELFYLDHNRNIMMNSVKEQRVDGSYTKRNSTDLVFKVYSYWFINKFLGQSPFLVNNKHVDRIAYKGNVTCSLIIAEKRMNTNFLVNKSLNFTRKLDFSAASTINTISDWWVAGFVDAEGCFRISIIKNKNYRANPWSPSIYSENTNGTDNNTIPLSVRLYFQIGLHLKDENVLKLIQSTLGVGKIYRSKTRPDSVELQVSSFKDMSALIKFFDNYPLITQKWADYLLFKQAYELILSKQHLTIQGLKTLAAIKALLNKGLPDQLKQAFPKLERSMQRCEVIKEIPDPHWIAGFTSGEGSFMVRVFKSASHTTGYQVQLRFQITQQNRDKFLMEKLVSYLGCGFISERDDIVDFIVTNFTDITDKIIPFFEKYQIVGVKFDNYNDFCKVAKLIKDKEHLTRAGLEKINLIKSKMNTLRDIN